MSRKLSKETEQAVYCFISCQSVWQSCNKRVVWKCFSTLKLITSAKENVFVVVCSSVCLFVSTLRKNFRTDLHEIFREGWQWASEQMNKFWWRSGLPSGYRDFFRIRHCCDIRKVVWTDCAARRYSALLGIAGITIATVTSLRHRPLAEVHCPSASCLVCLFI